MSESDNPSERKNNSKLPPRIRYDRDHRVPLIFSISGHRNIRKEDYKPLFDRLCIFFKAYKEKFSNTPMMLMTPLAEGGDIIATYAALEAGFIIAPVLLTDEEELCKTFIDVGGISKEDYSALVKGLINNYPGHYKDGNGNTFCKEPTNTKGFDTDNLADLMYRELNGIKLSDSTVKALWKNTENCAYSVDELIGDDSEPGYTTMEGPVILSKCTLHDNLSENSKRYNSQFKDVNAYLIANSHIIVALWDGHFYDYENGGTFNAVYMAFNGIGYKHLPYSHPMSPVTDLPERTNETMLNCMEDCPIYWIKVNNSDEKVIDRRISETSEQYVGHDRGDLMFDIESEGIYIVPKMIEIDEEEIKLDEEQEKKKSKKEKPYDGSYKGASCDVRCCARYLNKDKPKVGIVNRALRAVFCLLISIILTVFVIFIPSEKISRPLKTIKSKVTLKPEKTIDPDTERMILELYGEEGIGPKKESFDDWKDSLSSGNTHIKVNALTSDKMSAEMARRMYGILPGYYQKIFEKMDVLNADIRKEFDPKEKERFFYKISVALGRKVDPGQWDSRYYLLDKGSDSHVSDELVQTIKDSHAMDDMAVRYNVANVLAGRKDKIYIRWMIALIVIALFSAISFKYYILLDGALLFMLAYVILLFTTKTILYIKGETKTFKKFIEYRSLAETLRVQYYWGLLKINENTTAVSYGYMKNQTDWIRSVMRSWNSYFMNIYSMSNSIHLKESNTETINACQKGCCSEHDTIDVVRECWIRGQKRYHKKKEIKNKKKLRINNIHYRILETVTEFLALTALFAAILFNDYFQQIPLTVDAVYIFGKLMIPSYQFKMIHILKVFMIIAVALTAFFLSMKMRIRGGTPEQIRAKYRMFAIAEMRLKDIDGLKNVKDVEKQNRARYDILKELGEQCIAENNDWVFEHVSKDFKKGKTSDSVMDDNIM